MCIKNNIRDHRDHYQNHLSSFFRTRHLKCERQSCEELVVAHLGFLDYSYYIITVRFHGLESFHQRYTIRELTFYVSKHCIRNTIIFVSRHDNSEPCIHISCSQFKNYNPAFTQIEIWFRLIFLLTTFGVMVIYDRG